MELSGQNVIITGGASGLGEATARRMASAGAKVAIFDLNDEQGAQVASEIDGLYCRVNVASEEAAQNGLDKAEAESGPVRVLVNCAGIAPGSKTTSKGSPHDLGMFSKTIEVNLIGTFNMIRLAATQMAAADAIDGERGVIVNTASIAAFDGQIGQAAYSASKGGIVGMTLPIARDLSRDLIRVMTIAPGIFRTPLLAGLPQEVQDSLGAGVPNPSRTGDPDEFAALAQHIVENGYLNGEVIRIDGALRMAPR